MKQLDLETVTGAHAFAIGYIIYRAMCTRDSYANYGLIGVDVRLQLYKSKNRL